MSAKKIGFVVSAAIAVILALGIGFQLVGSHAQALPPALEPPAASVIVPYSGRLTNDAGQPVAEGVYDFTFALYTTAFGGDPLWSEVQKGVPVQEGVLAASLGSANPIPTTLLADGERWLAVEVRGPGEVEFTDLAPRQRLSAASPASPASPTAGTACPHDHWGETWSGDDQLWGLFVENNYSSAATGILGGSPAGVGVTGASATGYGVKGASDNGSGVYGYSSDSGHAIYAEKPTGSSGDAVYVAQYGTGRAGFWGVNNPDNSQPALEVNTNGNNSSGLKINKTGAGSSALDLQVWDPGGGQAPGHFIAAYDETSTYMFLVAHNGVVAATQYNTWRSDLAEMLPAVAGLEPGDVLVIGPDGKLARSTKVYQASVAGVYSTQPGFVGGQPMEGEVPDAIPLAIMGVVPVKVSTENGPIHPGDLLVASSTPGHAMKSDPNPPQGTVIGKALEGLDASQGSGIIRILAMLQ